MYQRSTIGVSYGALLHVIASGAASFDVAKGFAANRYGTHSPGQYSIIAALVTEAVMTMLFLFIAMSDQTAGPRQALCLLPLA